MCYTNKLIYLSIYYIVVYRLFSHQHSLLALITSLFLDCSAASAHYVVVHRLYCSYVHRLLYDMVDTLLQSAAVC